MIGLLLVEISRVQPERVVLSSGYQGIQSPRDLLKLAALCECRSEAERDASCSHRDVCCDGYNCPTKELGCPNGSGVHYRESLLPEKPRPAESRRPEQWPAHWPVRWKSHFLDI